MNSVVRWCSKPPHTNYFAGVPAAQWLADVARGLVVHRTYSVTTRKGRRPIRLQRQSYKIRPGVHQTGSLTPCAYQFPVLLFNGYKGLWSYKQTLP